MAAPQTIGELENGLFAAFPREDAESWDQPGLAVGNRERSVGKVAVALDMSVANVIAASDAGCDVLVTHHPAFIKEGPSEFAPETQPSAPGPGRMIYEAVERGVATIAMHTNADRAIATRERFANIMGCSCLGNCEAVLDGQRDLQDKGFGALLVPDWNERPTLGVVAELAARNFDCHPRVWGDSKRPVDRIAFLNGSWGDPDLYERCVAAGIDCVIVGETRYHLCVDAQPYLSIIELGHDRSELPIVDVLIDALLACDVSRDDILDLRGMHRNWWTA